MGKIQKDYLERVYAGWLGKLIGIRLGAPIEGWPYEKIAEVYGEIDGYLVDYREFAADDDSNGPIFFLRALTDYGCTKDITAEQIGLTWLNYAPYEHGFYWWGGYGKSTEHTAYMNMRSGIKPPESGSIALNGPAVAEQIGGQIFIDTWGLVAPGDYTLAADLAGRAASVAHDGNGVYGGRFIAACISAAFEEQEIEHIIEKGLSVIPEDCEYAQMAGNVISFHREHPGDWREAYGYVKEHYGYDKYPGSCHIIPNAAVVLLSLLYGNGDFTPTLNICNSCGWDTDCNAANVGTIIGVKNGLDGIDYDKWRKPINDFFACSSVIGSLNIMDVPTCAGYIAGLGYRLAGEEVPPEWRALYDGSGATFPFDLPGATHGFRAVCRGEGPKEVSLFHTTQDTANSSGALKLVAKPMNNGHRIRVYHKTYYRPEDFHDSRYDPSFSPTLYPGQTIRCVVKIPEQVDFGTKAVLYVKDGNSDTDTCLYGDRIQLKPGTWQMLQYRIPPLTGACIVEAGVEFIVHQAVDGVLEAYIDDFDFSGKAEYAIDFSEERMEVWHLFHREVSQFTYLKGIWELEGNELSGSCYDYAEAYTGGWDFSDYSFEGTLRPISGGYHRLNFRVQGAIRSYAIGLAPSNRLVIYKNENGYRELASIAYTWMHEQAYTFKIAVKGCSINISQGGTSLLEYEDTETPYLYGQIGVSTSGASHCHFSNLRIASV